MKISVIIPVYNAEKYVRNAIESALQQPETGEILLVEDNSPDNCLQICRDLEKKHEIVELLRHPDGRNHGAGASRNLGIKNAKFDYISFLDADDYYLPGRFEAARRLFEKYHDIDGVY
ncbi:MAG: glycosyltransferase family 2 protein, partial [Desulfobacteria bacterium]